MMVRDMGSGGWRLGAGTRELIFGEMLLFVKRATSTIVEE
jgi:hypothetical protein